MTPPMTPREKVEPFERYPALASWIAKMASVGSGLSLGEWMTFVGSLNAAIVQAEQHTALASGSGDHAELARLAAAATPGPWAYRDMTPNTYGPAFVDADDVRNLAICGEAVGRSETHGFCLQVDSEVRMANAAFIAAANPATVLALLAENAALRAIIDSVADKAMDQTDKLLAMHARAAEAERKLAEAEGALREIAKGEALPEQHGHYLAHRQAVDVARTFLSKEAERG